MIWQMHSTMALSVLLVCGCVTQQDSSSYPDNHRTLSQEIGEWENIHKGSDRLAGVIVNQYPDNAGAPDWEGKHPRMITYFMWDGTIHETHHFPDGSRIPDQEHLGKLQKAYEYLWHSVDFSHGNDPTFSRHEDPRLRIKKPEQGGAGNPLHAQ